MEEVTLEVVTLSPLDRKEAVYVGADAGELRSWWRKDGISSSDSSEGKSSFWGMERVKHGGYLRSEIKV